MLSTLFLLFLLSLLVLFTLVDGGVGGGSVVHSVAVNSIVAVTVLRMKVVSLKLKYTSYLH